MPIEGFTPYAKEDVEKYTKMRWWLGLTWGDMFNKHVDIYPDRIGLVDATGRWTNSEIRQAVDKLAVSFIRLGIKPKDRVFLQLPNWHEFVFAWLAIQRIGAIVVVLIPRYNQMKSTTWPSLQNLLPGFCQSNTERYYINRLLMMFSKKILKLKILSKLGPPEIHLTMTLNSL